MAHAPIAYTYEADYHCPACAVARFGQVILTTSYGSIDNEGNEVGTVAPWDEWWEPSEPGPQVLACGTCGVAIAEIAGRPCSD
jgi:hypothetical protein